MGIGLRLLIIVVVLATLPALLVGVIGEFNSGQALRQVAAENLVAAARQGTHAIDTVFQERI